MCLKQKTMSSSTDQKIDWLHNLIRTSGDASNAVMTKQSLEARLRARNDQLYTQCVAGGGAKECVAAFSGAHERRQHASLAGGGEEAVFLAQVRDTLGPGASPPARNAGEDLLSWKKRVVDAAAQTFAELHARLLSGGDKEPQAAVQQLKSATQQLKAQLGGDSSVMSVLSQCGGVDDSVIGALKTRLQQLNSMKQRLGGGGYVQATEINKLLRQTVDTLERYKKRIQTQAASGGVAAQQNRQLQAQLAQQKENYKALQAEKTTLETRLKELEANANAARTKASKAATAASAQAADLKNTQELNNNLKAELDGKVQAFDEKRASLVAQLEEKRTNIAQLETELHKSQKAYENAKKGLKEALDKEKQQCHVEDEALTAFNEKLAQLKDVLVGGALLKGGATKTAQEILGPATELVTLALNKVLSMQQALAKTQQEKREAHSEHVGQLRELTSNYEALKARKAEALVAAVEEKQKALASAAEEKQKELAAANEEKQKALAAAAEEKQKELAAANEEKQKALAAAAEENQKELAAAKAQCDANAEESTAEALRDKQEKLDAAAAEAERQKNEALDAAREAAAAASETLQSQHAAALSEVKKAAAAAAEKSSTDMTAMSAALARMKEELETIRKKLEAERTRADAAEATQIDDTDQAYQSFQQQLEALRSTLDSDDSAEATESAEELFEKKSLKPEPQSQRKHC